jgi:hypothetical protein
MTLTVKLGAELERALARRSAERGLTKSAVVKRALVEHLAREPESAYDAGRDLFGRLGSGDGSLSAHRREKYAALVDAKHRSRR